MTDIDAIVAEAKRAQAEGGTATEAGGGDAEQPAQPNFAELAASLPAGEIPIGMLLDLALPVSIELGRTSMTVADILRLGRGAVIQLERLAGEPIDIYVGDRRFAEGEVVVLGEHFGVRITRIISRVLEEAV